MIPRRTFDAVGLFDQTYPLAGDLEFYNRVAERFPILRNGEVKHAVRTHQLITSALPTSSARYLREELKLADWYRKHWSEPELKKKGYVVSGLICAADIISAGSGASLCAVTSPRPPAPCAT